MAVFVALTSYQKKVLVDFSKVSKVEPTQDGEYSHEYIFYMDGTSFHYTLSGAVEVQIFFEAVFELAKREDWELLLEEEDFCNLINQIAKLKAILLENNHD